MRDERQKGIRECDRRERKEQRETESKEKRETERNRRIGPPTLRLSLVLTYLTIHFLLLGCYSLGTP